MTIFVKYWKDNHNSLVVSDPSRDICSLYHVFANRHNYNISNKEMFLPESEREGDNKDTMTHNLLQNNDPKDIPLAALEEEI